MSSGLRPKQFYRHQTNCKSFWKKIVWKANQSCLSFNLCRTRALFSVAVLFQERLFLKMAAKVASPTAPAAPPAPVSTPAYPTSVVVHPLVLLSVVDHFNRMGKIGNQNRVVGVLLGSWSTKNQVRVPALSSYLVPEFRAESWSWCLKKARLQIQSTN